MKEKREKESWRSGEVKRGEEKQFNVELWTERSRCAQRAAFLVWRSIRETHTRARTNKLTHCWRRIASDCWQVHTHITSVTKLHGEATSLRLYQFCSYLLACASLSCLLLQTVVMVYCNITYLVWWPGSEVGDDGLRITSFPWTSRSCAAAHTSHQERMQKIKPDKKNIMTKVSELVCKYDQQTWGRIYVQMHGNFGRKRLPLVVWLFLALIPLRRVIVH